MRGVVKHAWLLLTVPLLLCVPLAASVLIGSAGEPASLVVGALAAVVLAGVLVARAAAVVLGSSAVAVGERARQHGESLVGRPEPQHPGTPGRPRTRAPAGALAAA